MNSPNKPVLVSPKLIMLKRVGWRGAVSTWVLSFLRYLHVSPQKRTVIAQKVGMRIVTFARNPMLDYPRNMTCPCGAGLKFKNCHLPQLPDRIPAEEVDRIMVQLRKIKSLSRGGNGHG